MVLLSHGSLMLFQSVIQVAFSLANPIYTNSQSLQARDFVNYTGVIGRYGIFGCKGGFWPMVQMSFMATFTPISFKILLIFSVVP